MVVELKGGFKTLLLRFDSSCSAPHQLFYKEHSIRNQEPEHPKGRTLFILNVPPWASSKSLKKIFAKLCGKVKSTTMPDSGKNSSPGFSKVYVVFERESSLDKALSLPRDTLLTLHSDEEVPDTAGLTKWFKEYNATVMCNEKVAKRKIEEYMRNYDMTVAQRLAEDEDNHGEEGDDGWTTITTKKKRGQFAPARKESTISKLQSKEERKNRKKELLNFYTFQIRESKKQNVVELRKKFELDKKKLQQLKSNRTFKPF